MKHRPLTLTLAKSLAIGFMSISLSQAAVITSGLVGEYTFQGGNSNDSTGLIGNGTAVGAPTYSTLAGGSTVLNLSPGNYITIANDPDIPSGSATRTVALWVSITTYGLDAAPFRSGNTANQQDFSLEMDAASGTLTANGWNADTNFTAATGTGQWHHVVISFDGTNVHTYFDGAATEIGGPFTLNLNTAQNGIRFGGPRIGRTTNDTATQSIDDVLIYSRALSGGEITTIFNAGPSMVPEPSSALLAVLGLLGFARRRR